MKYRQRLVILVPLAFILITFLSFRILTTEIGEEQRHEKEETTPELKKDTVSKMNNNHVTHPASHVSESESHTTLQPSLKTTLPNEIDFMKPWHVWATWVQTDQLYPQHVFYSNEMNSILQAMSTYPVTSFDIGYKGTQLKTSMYLKGNQRTVFKPMRFRRDAIIDGPDDPCKGQDRHNGEIASFHLDGILGYRIAPPVVGRRINLTEILPVTSPKLYKTYSKEDGNTCFYGRCLYCKPSERACGKGDIMEGSVTLWLPDWYQLRTWRHPYQRTYIPNVKARWEMDNNYCTSTLLSPSSDYYYILPDIFDTMVMDFLIGNADRHHFETYSLLGKKAHLMHIDNGKSFGNPFHDEMSILAPLRQCCKMRNSTWIRLHKLQKQPLSQLLDSSLQRDPLYPVITQDHLTAIDRRLDTLIKEIQQCINKHGINSVLFNNWEDHSVIK